jgi:hypothetical protein
MKFVFFYLTGCAADFAKSLGSPYQVSKFFSLIHTRIRTASVRAGAAFTAVAGLGYTNGEGGEFFVHFF